MPREITTQFYRPVLNDKPLKSVARKFLLNYPTEVQRLSFTEAEKKYIFSKGILGKLFQEQTRPFYLHHFSWIFGRVAQELMIGRQRPLVVDLGSGSGTGSLLLALMGARVVGLDITPEAVSASQRRKQFYESLYGPLDLEFHVANALTFDYTSLGQIDGVFSVFAFPWMQPNEDVLAHLLPAMAPHGKVVLANGNDTRLGARPMHGALSYDKLRAKFNELGYRTDAKFHCSIPAVIAKYKPGLMLGKGVEQILRATGLLRWVCASYMLTCGH